jgi:hypothetical protein
MGNWGLICSDFFLGAPHFGVEAGCWAIGTEENLVNWNSGAQKASPFACLCWRSGARGHDWRSRARPGTTFRTTGIFNKTAIANFLRD